MARCAIFFFVVACTDSAELLSPRDSGSPLDVTIAETGPADVLTADATDAYVDAGCIAGFEKCKGTCVDPSSYQSDEKNCGFCAHDCLGNSCTAGLCSAEVIGTDLPNPVALAVNSSTVYFATIGDSMATSGSIYQCPVTGCFSKLGPMTTGLNNPEAIAIDGASVYWNNAGGLAGNTGSVMSCPLGDCGKGDASRKTLAQNLSFTMGIALDGANIYFGTWGASPYFGNATIHSCPLSGCSGTPPSVMTGESEPAFIALDGSTLFMATTGGSGVAYIESGPLPGPSAGTRVFTATTVDSINGMAIYGGHIFFANNVGDSIEVCTETNCTTPITLALATSPSSMAVDSEGVYWIDDAGIETCPVAGCASNKPLLLATSANAPMSVAVQGSFVYWVEWDPIGTAGQLLRVAR